MIHDMTAAILSLSSVYQKMRTESYKHNGVTYTDTTEPVDIRGCMMPMDYVTQKEFQEMGYVTAGMMQFFVPASEGVLDEKDVIVDADGVQWKMIPKTKDYTHLGGFVKYILTKDVV